MDCGRLLKPILTREELCVSRKLCDAQHIVFLWSDKFFSFFGKYYDFSENCIEIIYTGIHTLMTNFFLKYIFSSKFPPPSAFVLVFCPGNQSGRGIDIECFKIKKIPMRSFCECSCQSYSFLPFDELQPLQLIRVQSRHAFNLFMLTNL